MFVGPVELVILLAMCAMYGLVVWACCRICAKAGFPAVLGLLSLVPLLNLVLVVVLGFIDWPALANRREFPGNTTSPM
jgi:hypothetical protein